MKNTKKRKLETDNVESRNKKRRLTEIPKTTISAEQHCLNRLVRLFEKTTQGCTSICFVQNKILITDNEIFHGTTGKSNKYKLICNTMNYFSDLANKSSTTERKNKVFEQICLKRIKGEESGYIKIPEEIIKSIAQKTLSKHSHIIEQYQEKTKLGRLKNLVEMTTQIKNEVIDEYKLSYDDLVHVSTSCEIIALLVRDFLKIENFLTKENYKESDLIKAFQSGVIKRDDDNMLDVRTDKHKSQKKNQPLHYGLNYAGYELMQQENINEKGYIILKIGEQGVHTEVKLIDYLLLTNTLQQRKEPLYIAISKYCCFDCRMQIKAVNQYFSKQKGLKEDLIQHIGVHGLKFKTIPPLFLTDIAIQPEKKFYLKHGKNIRYYNNYDEANNYVKSIKKINKPIVTYIRMDNDLIKSIKACYKEIKKVGYEASTGVKMQQRSSSSEEESLSSDITMFKIDTPKKTISNAFNQANNDQYSYQKEDLNIIGIGLTKGSSNANFTGVLNAKDIEAKLNENKDLKDKQKIVGVYEAGNNQWITFCIENTDGSIKAYYSEALSGRGSNIQNLRNALKKVFNIKQLIDCTDDNPLNKEKDYGLLSLAYLKNFILNPAESFHSNENEEQHNKQISNLRTEFANAYAQQNFGKTKVEMDIISTIWQEVSKKITMPNITVLTSIEEKLKALLKFFEDNTAIFKGIKINYNNKETTLFDIFVEEDNNETKLRPNALLLIEELLQVGKQKQQTENSKEAYKTGSNVSNAQALTNEQIIAEYYSRFGDFLPSGFGSYTKTSGATILHEVRYKEGGQFNAFNQYFDQKYEYQGEDILNIGKQIINEFKENIEFIGALGKGRNAGPISVQALLGNYRNLLGIKEKPGIGIYNVNENHWITFGIISQANKHINVVYKDSLGIKRPEFELEIENAFPKSQEWVVKIDQVKVGEKEQNEMPLVSCGLFALQNMKIMAQALKDIFLSTNKHTDETLKTLFEENEFYKPGTKGKTYQEEIKELREEFVEKWINEIYNVNFEGWRNRKIQQLQAEQMMHNNKSSIDNLTNSLSANLGSPIEIRLDINSGDNEKEKLGRYSYTIVLSDNNHLNDILNSLKKIHGLESLEEDVDYIIEGKSKKVIKISGKKIDEHELEIPNININQIVITEEERRKEFLQALNINERLPSEFLCNYIKELIGLEIPSHKKVKEEIATITQNGNWRDSLKTEEMSELILKIYNDNDIQKNEVILSANNFFAAHKNKDKIFEKYIKDILNKILTSAKENVIPALNEKYGEPQPIITESNKDAGGGDNDDEKKEQHSEKTNKGGLTLDTRALKANTTKELEQELTESEKSLYDLLETFTLLSEDKINEQAVIIKDIIETSKLLKESLKKVRRKLSDKLITEEKEDIKKSFSMLLKVVDKVNLKDQHLKKAEKGILGKDFNLQKALIEANPDFLNTSALEEILTQTKNEIKLTSNLKDTNLKELGKVTLIPESDHTKEHNENVDQLIQYIKNNVDGYFNEKTVIVLERKYDGKNLGLADIITLAEIIKYNKINKNNSDKMIVVPEEVKKSPIYKDAKLYNLASEKGIAVLGAEGKNLGIGNKDREEYMWGIVASLVEQGKDVLYILGKAHVANLKLALEAQSITVNIDLENQISDILSKKELILSNDRDEVGTKDQEVKKVYGKFTESLLTHPIEKEPGIN